MMPYPLPFGVNRGIEQEKRVAVYKGIRNAVFGSFDGGGVVHQGIVRNLPHQAQVEYGLFDAQIPQPAGTFQLDGMALPVLESNGLDVFALVDLDCLNQAGGRILTARKDDQGFWFDISNPSFGNAEGLRTAKLDSKDAIAMRCNEGNQTASERHAV